MACSSHNSPHNSFASRIIGGERGFTIDSIDAYEAIDSRGFPTVAATVNLACGASGTAFVPSGASTGEYEAHELRDGDPTRFGGKGVTKAVANVVEKLSPLLHGANVLDIAQLDRIMMSEDGSDNKAQIGANAILGVSLAAAHAGANALGIPLFQHLGGTQACQLPVPLVNVINGGAHAQNSIDFQEFMLVPVGGERFSDNLRIASEVFHTLKKNLKKAGLSTGLGDEGGFAPDLETPEAAIKTLVDAITDAGYTPGADVAIALDVAASELYDRDKGAYFMKKGSGEKCSSEDLIDLYAELAEKFPLVSIEDGLDENDWDGWTALNKKLGARVQLVGDDLFVTNRKRLDRGIEEKAGNSILIKLNQIGSVSETLETIRRAHECRFTTVISHRSGETEDTSIADLAVAVNAGQIKTGSVCRGERTAKYNRLLWIEQYLGESALMKNPFAETSR